MSIGSELTILVFIILVAAGLGFYVLHSYGQQIQSQVKVVWEAGPDTGWGVYGIGGLFCAETGVTTQAPGPGNSPNKISGGSRYEYGEDEEAEQLAGSGTTLPPQDVGTSGLSSYPSGAVEIPCVTSTQDILGNTCNFIGRYSSSSAMCQTNQNFAEVDVTYAPTGSGIMFLQSNNVYTWVNNPYAQWLAALGVVKKVPAPYSATCQQANGPRSSYVCRGWIAGAGPHIGFEDASNPGLCNIGSYGLGTVVAKASDVQYLVYGLSPQVSSFVSQNFANPPAMRC